MYNSDIISHRRFVCEQIRKSFNHSDCDLEKAVAMIGEIRHWQDGDYKKVGTGEWVKVGTNKSVSSSTMQKIISAEYERLEREFQKIKKDFEDSANIKGNRSSVTYKVLLEKAWNDEVVRNEFIHNIRAEQKDLSDELNEIKIRIKAQQKLNREKKAGKKELDEKDVEPFISTIRSTFVQINKNIPRIVTADVVFKDVTPENYFLDTETDFSNICADIVDYKKVDDKWKELKNKGFEWHKSPKSDSEYLIDKKSGDVYRLSDHWGRVASCNWYIDSDSDNVYTVGKSNLKNFKRKVSGSYLNPDYSQAITDASKRFLSKIKELVSDNDKFYLAKKALKNIDAISETIYNDYLKNAGFTINEIDRLKKECESY